MSDNNSEPDIDAISGVSTTGHEWDGIRELNNPLPRWWLWTFYASIIFAIGYMTYYPAIPLINGATQGISGTTNRSLIEDELRSVRRAQSAMLERIARTPIDKIRSDNALYRFAIAGGKSNFKVYCSQCHGSGAQGAPGYPNLNDDDWLWGGDLESINTTILHGIRDERDDDTRVSEMPAFGKDDILKKDQIRAVAEHVMKLSGRDFDASLASRGAEIFSVQCSACHGETGQGGREVGAPNLADALSLYGDTRKIVMSQISSPRHGVMPSWIGRLGVARIKQLAIYVHSLGGGEKSVPAG